MKQNIGKQKIKNMISNAIILAAGKSTRFASFTYERPKGLFRVKGEYLLQVHRMSTLINISIIIAYAMNNPY